MPSSVKSVCVYCASSPSCGAARHAAASDLGGRLARSGYRIVYGAGSTGLMGALADGALAAGGEVVGVIPEFMKTREWDHPHISELYVVQSMHQRKQMMLDLADAYVALPGGSGTLEELTEAISFKRLGLIDGPIFIANWDDYYAPLVEQFDAIYREHFLGADYRGLYEVVSDNDELLSRLADPPAGLSSDVTSQRA